ncbi:Bacterial extracellular solute-binding protein [Streptomyces sp. YIM 130001]|uniref:extracellular solute-binding protein n=1 Tax=Streptomyces sp. YIM 130001 TaxID=2259644 RepID=UPI000E65D76F|nr:extracellular solute-binding protein [Streptomyces sp. YIM 130001]RII13923.1 Bacterial extracellular solute-binding protein [Streptomyces sp. YIM 130001]
MRRRSLPAAGAGVLLSLTGCAPGGFNAERSRPTTGPVSKNLGNDRITLHVWDQNTDEGPDQAQRALNRAFEKRHPHIRIERVARAFGDLKMTLRLALSGEHPPDVVQANQSYPDMGAFVKAGLLRPLNDYARLYGWDTYYPSSLLKLNSFSPDGRTWQGRDLYGISQTGELVGLYFHPGVLREAGVQEPPRTVADLTDALHKVKATGTLPLAFGNVEAFPGIHLYGFVHSALAGRQKANDLVTASGGAWTDPEPVEAAQVIHDWSARGYVTSGANGISTDDALADFRRGRAAFHISGTWQEAPLTGAGIGFTVLTPPGSPTPVTMGGEGLPFAITARSKHPDAAAAYIDFVSGATAAPVLAKSGNLPVVEPRSRTRSRLATDITRAYQRISKANAVTPYLDYTTPTFYDTLTAGMQDLLAGEKSPREFTRALQTDHADFRESNR